MKSLATIVLCLVLLIFSSCDKGYNLRFINYYLEPMDSVVVGANVLVFKNVETQSSSDFLEIKKGTYGVTCITKTKKKFTTEITIPSKGSGQRSLQIDGLATFVLLEE
ncbi:MAG: hypothetical protein MUF75_08570 [Bacteroidia bacterium]|nr:hypothetical protein [Bacteroidia bacterium]